MIPTNLPADFSTNITLDDKTVVTDENGTTTIYPKNGSFLLTLPLLILIMHFMLMIVWLLYYRLE